MKPSVYWFSGTGNSLWAAKTLGGHLQVAVEPMARYTDGGVQLRGESPIVLVFPVYNHQIPFLVQRFVALVPTLKHTAVYAVCTYGDSPGISLEYLQKRIMEKGGTLAGGFAVKMPYNYISPTGSLCSFFRPFKLRENPEETQERLFREARLKLTDAAQTILEGNIGTLETADARIERLAERLNLRNTLQKRFWLKKAGYRWKTQMTSVESIQLMDVGFFCTDACTGCQTCARVCPVENIRMDGGKPSWQRRCEQCFACLQWCPAQAIQFREGTRGCKRYHHPMIRVKDIIIRTNNKE